MSFAADIRNELSHMPCDKRAAALGELCAIALLGGGITFRGANRYALVFNVGSAAAAERCLSMAQRFLRVDCALGSRESHRLGGQTRYVVIPDDVPSVLAALDLFDPAMPFGLRATPTDAILATEDARRAFLRGAFLTCGRMTDPTVAYHLEFAIADESAAFAVIALLERFAIRVGLFERKGQYVVYCKESESIGDLLRLLGASRAVLRLEDVRVMKELRNDVNRQTNCDTNNVEKAVEAASRQTAFIRRIEEGLGLDDLPDPLRDVALLRLQYPDATLAELGEMATPALGKSGVSARMRKLERIAETLPDAGV